MRLLSVLEMVVGTYWIVLEIIKVYCIIFLKRPYKDTEKNFNYCFRSALYYIGYSILGIFLGVYILIYGYTRYSYDGQIFNGTMMMLYFIIISFWFMFKSQEEKIKNKYSLKK